MCFAAAGALVSTGVPAAAEPRSPAKPISRCDWPVWGQRMERPFASPCPTGISAQTAKDLKQIWFFNAKDTVTATPAVVDGVAYVGDWSGNFYAIDVKTGKPRWTYQAHVHGQVYAGQIVSSAAVADVKGVRTVFFAGGKTLYALRADDGSERWKHEVGRRGDDERPQRDRVVARRRRRPGRLRHRRAQQREGRARGGDRRRRRHRQGALDHRDRPDRG